MCVRCGTGSVAWCTSPDRHASERSHPGRDLEVARILMTEREIAEQAIHELEEDELRRVNDFIAYLRACRP